MRKGGSKREEAREREIERERERERVREEAREEARETESETCAKVFGFWQFWGRVLLLQRGLYVRQLTAGIKEPNLRKYKQEKSTPKPCKYLTK